MRIHFLDLLVLATGYVLLTSCSTAPEPPTSRFSLPFHSSITTAATVDGSTEVVVTIPPGHPGQGTWRSRDPQIIPAAHGAQKRLDELDVVILIDVDEAGRIVGFVETTTMR